ncbi:MAG TPA: putative quinol monooxygenase [Aliidongia sp.]|uniref:putative quinol monooxygenase n=1 Tax=Aliidongia sp. TaxID=1914230 RepID=UPI002DDD6020|nr:putative quinol monooxygenase [Aliidongia sp.]HEV2674764.1 putative quinol monooxygenase [Aliidongia sp.]
MSLFENRLRVVRTRRTLVVILLIAAAIGACAIQADAQEASAGGPVRVVAILRAKPGQENEARRSLLALVSPSRAEPGCVTYEINQPADDQALFVYYEVWRSRADLDAHFQRPYFKALADRLGELLAEPAEIKVLTSITP